MQTSEYQYTPIDTAVMFMMTRQDLMTALVAIPEQVRVAAAAVAEARGKYARRTTHLSVTALELPLFTAKDGSKRPAANESERELAIKYAVEHDATARRYRLDLDAANRNLNQCRAREKNYRMIARLMLVEGDQ